MLDLVPAQVADVNETLDAVLKLSEHAEACDIAYDCLMLASYRILLTDRIPRIRSELFHAEGHLAGLAIDGEDLSLNLVANLQEVLSRV